MDIAPFELERYFARYEFTAPHLLACSDCQAMSVAELLDMAPEYRERLNDLWLGYTESPGALSLRATIAATYTGIAADDILVHTGAEEAIFTFVNGFLKPGDRVLVHRPCYQSLHEVARANGCQVIDWWAREEKGWRLDLDLLADEAAGGLTAVILNTPHNPTGWLMERADFETVFRIAEEHGIVVFCDEVYRGLEYDPSAKLPAACEMSEAAVSLGVMSKSQGLAGLRIGWAATRNRAVMKAMAAFKDYTTICNSAPGELLAEAALSVESRIVGRNLDLIRANLALVDDFFSRRAGLFNWQRPTAGPIAFPSLKTGSTAQWGQRLVDRAGILIAPGHNFGPGLEANFRIGFGRMDLPEKLQLLARDVDQHGI